MEKIWRKLSNLQFDIQSVDGTKSFRNLLYIDKNNSLIFYLVSPLRSITPLALFNLPFSFLFVSCAD